MADEPPKNSEDAAPFWGSVLSFITKHSAVIGLVIGIVGGLIGAIFTLLYSYISANNNRLSDEIIALDAKMTSLVEQINKRGADDYEERCRSLGYDYDGAYCLFKMIDPKIVDPKMNTRVRRERYEPLQWVARTQK